MINCERVDVDLRNRADIERYHFLPFRILRAGIALHAAVLAEEVCDVLLVESVFGEVVFAGCDRQLFGRNK